MLDHAGGNPQLRNIRSARVNHRRPPMIKQRRGRRRNRRGTRRRRNNQRLTTRTRPDQERCPHRNVRHTTRRHRESSRPGRLQTRTQRRSSSTSHHRRTRIHRLKNIEQLKRTPRSQRQPSRRSHPRLPDINNVQALIVNTQVRRGARVRRENPCRDRSHIDMLIDPCAKVRHTSPLTETPALRRGRQHYVR